MVGDPGLDQQSAAGVAGPDQPGRPGQQGQRLLAGAEAGRQQVLVDVEEGHHVGTWHPVERRLGAHHQPGLGQAGTVRRVGRPGDLAGLDPGQGRASSSVARVTPIRRVLRRVASHSAHTVGRVLTAPSAAQPATGLVLGHGSPAPGAAGQRAAVGAGQQPGPSGPVEDAHHPPVGPVEDRVEQAGQALGEQPGARIVPGPVDHLDDGPAPPLHGSGRW